MTDQLFSSHEWRGMKSGRRTLAHDEFLDKCELSLETIAQLHQCLICAKIAGFLRA